MELLRLDGAAWRLRAVVAVCAGVAAAASVEARVTRIVIDSTTAVTGRDIPYETLRGRAFGELDPNDPHNAIITDIQLGKDRRRQGPLRDDVHADQAGRHVAGERFHVARRAEPRRRHHHRRDRAQPRRRRPGERLAGRQRRRAPRSRPIMRAAPTTGSRCRWRARTASSSPATVLGRIVNRSGADSQPLNVMGNPMPYLPATLDTTRRGAHDAHAGDGERRRSREGSDDSRRPTGPSRTAMRPTRSRERPTTSTTANLPGNLPVHVCLQERLRSDPALPGRSTRPRVRTCSASASAAFRDVGSFFRTQAADDFGTPNPIAGRVISWAVDPRRFAVGQLHAPVHLSAA